MRAVQITEFGGPEVLTVVDVPEPEAGPGQKLYDVSTAGINYADTHQIENSYLAEQKLPLVPGAEFVGTPVGGGQRVVGLLDGGGYAEKVVAHDFLTWAVPDGVTDEQALAVVLQGSTAWHLLRTSAHLAEGETVVVIAGAGGVGSLAVQLARRWGAGRVIATASSPEKRQLAEQLGAHATVDPALADDDPKAFTGALREANGGRPVDIVLEMTGGNVFSGSLSALAPFGRLVTYGMAARARTHAVPPGILMQKSRAVIGFWLAHCMARPQMMDAAMTDLLALVDAGELKPVVGGRYPLSAVADAHQDLLARRTTGKLVLDPSS
ncbi:NADPH:quinone oxidoreductase family protein [Blastococcus sp. MG754426]|uniref:quinone oxidoreductase family protein n=1 Tax=unclassified Blastococcus TaxID=2619396 RepID=UPI001EEFEEE0|nr:MULTISPECIES: NADPH:quinone oxidoreductase family protein [unclassified Blastococcus]MCF6508952.1 NADPH:quinone oxidoreductase family protein [Blastococcus sp. MG754426]MCF6512838.1 NADPH:quinone oxidoreductase family protein [Blastococcus sp. MG754427]